MGCCWPSSKEFEQPPEGNHSTLMIPQKIQENSSLEQRAQSFKVQGNNHFKNKNYVQSVVCYQKAIKISPQPIYFSNLALAYKANEQYSESIEIVDQLLKLTVSRDPSNGQLVCKAKLIKGRSILILAKNYSISESYSQKQDIDIRNKLQQGVIIFNELKFSNANIRIQASKYEKTMEKVKEFFDKTAENRNKHGKIIKYLQKRLLSEEAKKNEKIRDFYPDSASIIKLFEMEMKIEANKFIEATPQFIQDPITYDIFENPVLVPSGLTYEEGTLRQHFSKNGYNDPITHEKYAFGQKVIVRNTAMKDYIVGKGKIIAADDILYLQY